MTLRELKEIVDSVPDHELDQEVQVHDHQEGRWFFDVDVEPNHDGVCEISITHGPTE